MRSFSVLLALLFAFAATSYAWPNAIHTFLEVRDGKGNRNRTSSNGGDPTRRACSQMRRLTKLTQLASNQTRLDQLVAQGKMDTAMVDALKAKAAEATTKLQEMSSNSTLTTACATINAERKTREECRQMKRLQKFANMANNQTAMDAFIARKGLNASEAATLKERAQQAQTKLQTLSSNSTLTTICAQRKGQKGGQSTNSSTPAGSNSGSGSTSGTNGAAGNAAQQASRNGAMGLGAKISQFALVPTLVGVFFMLM